MKNVLVFAALGIALTACSGIRVVRASKAGGEIALIGDREGAMDKARDEMARVCGGPNAYEVVEEGEAVVGEVTDTRGSASQGTGVFGQPTTYGSAHSETTQKTEWRVKYACKGAQPPPSGNPPPANPPPTGQPVSQIHTLIVRF